MTVEITTTAVKDCSELSTQRALGAMPKVQNNRGDARNRPDRQQYQRQRTVLPLIDNDRQTKNHSA